MIQSGLTFKAKETLRTKGNCFKLGIFRKYVWPHKVKYQLKARLMSSSEKAYSKQSNWTMYVRNCFEQM